MILILILVVISLFKNINESNITERLGKFETSITKELGEFKSDFSKNINNDFILLNDKIEDRLLKINDKVNGRIDENFEKNRRRDCKRIARASEARVWLHSVGRRFVQQDLCQTWLRPQKAGRRD